MDPPVESYADPLRNDNETFVAFCRSMIESGHLLLLINLRRALITASHTEEDVDRTLRDARRSAEQIARKS